MRTGTLEADALNALRANPDVDYIAEDGILHINAAVTQSVFYLKDILRM